MLEGLERIDWGRLTHAYGPAGDVPGRLRELDSDDAAVRRRAFEVLEGSIGHQGSRYRASAPAIPFLFELLESPSAKDRTRLIGLLTHLAIGYPEWHVPLGFEPSRRFAEIETLGGPEEIARVRDAEPDEEDDSDPGRDALWQRDAHEAVLGRIATLQGLTRDGDPDVRSAAVKALAWFPGAARESARFVRDALARESGPKDRANALLSLGLLDRYRDDRSDVPALLDCLSPAEAPSVRLAAAMSLAVILETSTPPESLEVLLEAVQAPEAPDLVGWHWLGPIAHAATAITAAKPGPTGPVLDALCRAAERVSNPWSGAEVINTLLGLVFHDPEGLPLDPRTGFRRVAPGSLTPAQRRVIHAIGRAPVWHAEPYHYGMLMDVGLEYGLPWQPERYRALLEEVRQAESPGTSVP